MASHGEIIASLKAKGHRLTPQRIMILNAIAEGGGHMGAEEIYEQVRKVYPYMDLTTVYRTLQFLKSLHVITEIGLGPVSHYELSGEDRHHHMVCQRCGKAISLSPKYLEALRHSLLEEFGFEPDLEHFAIGGTCSVCRGEKEPGGGSTTQNGG